MAKKKPLPETPSISQEVDEVLREVPALEKTERVSLRNIGHPYTGYDKLEYIEVARDRVIEVSPEKAKQLLTDFPENWTEV